MLNRVKGFLQSEQAMPVINGLFLLALLFRGSGIIFLAYGLWLAYLFYCLTHSKSKIQRGFYIVFALFVTVMLLVNAYSYIYAHMHS